MSSEHPIQGLMQSTMENLRDMIDVNTIIGEPVETPDGGHVIIPISKVGFGFAAGGSEFGNAHKETNHEQPGNKHFPFGGGSGGGVSITPVGFIVVGDQGIRMLNTEGQNNLFDRLIDVGTELVQRVGNKKSDSTSVAQPPIVGETYE
jgi:sporulation protein YtfJ